MNILAIDCHALCYQAFYTLGHLSYREVRTGVVFGFLKDVVRLRDEFRARATVLCFDSRKSKRKELAPWYKLRRHTKELTKEEELAREELYRQVHALRTKHLPRMGFANVWMQEGYESDDLLAGLAQSVSATTDRLTVVSGDHDLLQILAPNVELYRPSKHKVYTDRQFARDFPGLRPRDYAKVLAIAGCKTDEVPGVPGVGEKTAVKFLTGQLRDGQAKRDAIIAQWQSVVLRNKPLVKLPFEGTDIPFVTEDRFSQDGWREVCLELGISSIPKPR